MMTNLFLSVLGISLSVSPIIVLLLLLSPLLNRRYATKWSYMIWIFLAVRLLVPFDIEDGRAAMEMMSKWKAQLVSQFEPQVATQPAPQGDTENLPGREAPGRIVLEIPARVTAPLAAEEKSGVTPLDVIALVWGTGCALYIVINIVCCLHYKRRVLKNGTVLKDRALLEQLFRLKRELRIRRNVVVVEFSEAGSPMLLGYLRPVLIVNRSVSDGLGEQELYFILKHELVHLRRGDLYAKLLFMAACALHWFNPLVWLMQKEAVVDMELSCDEKVIKGALPAQKRAYTETLLSTLHKGSARNTVLSTGFYEGKQVMKKRFRNILRRRKKKNGCYVLAFAIALTVCMGTLAGCSVAKGNKGELSDAGQFVQMAGYWAIDFDRTDPSIWGTGISLGNGMEISESGALLYYIGITAGGTGQCEENDGEIRVEIEPYEAHSEEKEILTLKYEKDGGVEYILMNWYGETVYWKRPAKFGQASTGEVAGVDSNAENSEEDTITLTFMKEGMPEEKQAELVVENEYVLFLPVGEWQKAEADMWQAVVNEDVRIWVAGFEGDYPAEQLFANDGYLPEDEGMAKREDGLCQKVKFHVTEDKIWCVGYSYPEEAEEGFGMELPVIADTFAVIVPGERITERFIAGSAQVLGYISRFGGGSVTIDRQDWVTWEDPNWKPEYDADAGFEIVDIAGEDITYPLGDGCRYFILENHQGEQIEIDEGAFAEYLRETDFPIFWSVEVQEGQVISFAEWYRP